MHNESSSNTLLKKQRTLIEIIGDLKLQERKVFNIALRSAEPQLLEELMKSKRTKKPISVRLLTSDLLYFLGVKRNSLPAIKNNALSLTQRNFKYNVFVRADGTYSSELMSAASSFFTKIEIGSETCIFHFNPDVLDLLSNDNLCAHLNLLEQKQLSSKYSQVLWELCSLPSQNGEDEYFTEIYPLANMRSFLGVTGKSYYKDNARLLAKIIRPACKEISAMTLATSIEVQPIMHKQEGKPVGIYFSVKKRSRLKEVFSDVYTKFALTYEYKYLRKLRYSEDRIHSFLDIHGITYLTDKVSHLQDRVSDRKLGPLKSLTSWFERCLSEDYSNPYAGIEEQAITIVADEENKGNIVEYTRLYSDYVEMMKEGGSFINAPELQEKLHNLFININKDSQKDLLITIVNDLNITNNELSAEARYLEDYPTTPTLRHEEYIALINSLTDLKNKLISV